MNVCVEKECEQAFESLREVFCLVATDNSFCENTCWIQRRASVLAHVLLLYVMTSRDSSE